MLKSAKPMRSKSTQRHGYADVWVVELQFPMEQGPMYTRVSPLKCSSGCRRSYAVTVIQIRAEGIGRGSKELHPAVAHAAVPLLCARCAKRISKVVICELPSILRFFTSSVRRSFESTSFLFADIGLDVIGLSCLSFLFGVPSLALACSSG